MIETPTKELLSESYQELLKEIKNRIRSSQIKAAVSVNQELIKLYWEIGQFIRSKQEKEGWGGKIIEKLAKDLKSSFPSLKGFSPRNIQYMVTFAREYPELSITQQVVAQIPWGHNTLLLDKITNCNTRVWYIQQTLKHGWSRNVLLHWIEGGLYEKQGKALTNCKETLPEPQSDLAQETLKNPYTFDFLTLRTKFDEKELEDGLIEHIQKFLIELGHGFAFLGRQYPITVDKDTYHLDLLFYHIKLYCYVVVELKAGPFDPRDSGQMNFYLSAVDSMLRSPKDNQVSAFSYARIKKG